jgi:hypothetical protein
MIDKFKRLSIDANKYDEIQFDSAINVLSESLSAPQRHIFDWILVQLRKEHESLLDVNELQARRIKELQMQLTFKGVPDDGC